MPCAIGCLALSTPRLALLLMWLFTDYINRAYDKNIWPLLGFVFLPTTTIAVAAARNEHGSVDGWWLGLVILALLVDLGWFRWKPWQRRRRDDARGGGGPSAGPPPPSPPVREITVKGERVG